MPNVFPLGKILFQKLYFDSISWIRQSNPIEMPLNDCLFFGSDHIDRKLASLTVVTLIFLHVPGSLGSEVS